MTTDANTEANGKERIKLPVGEQGARFVSTQHQSGSGFAQQGSGHLSYMAVPHVAVSPAHRLHNAGHHRVPVLLVEASEGRVLIVQCVV